MSAALDIGKRALTVVREQLTEAAAARKCHGCGCLQQTVSTLSATQLGPELADVLDAARSVFVEKKYDCLGCSVCYPAIAANAVTEAFPDIAGDLELCPTESPEARSGWPPLPGDYRALRYTSAVAVCTLNDAALAARVADLALPEVAIVGTLSTENLGIERLIVNVLANPNIRRMVLCGDDTRQAVGHLPGQSLSSLFEHGVDDRSRIRGARGRRPVLKNVTAQQIDAFRAQVELLSAIGERDLARVRLLIQDASRDAPPPFEGAPSALRVERVHASEPRRLVQDPAGYFVVYPDARRGLLSVEHFSNGGVLTCVLEGATPAALYATVIERGLISRLDHAAYLGRELARAARSLETGEAYVQDRAAGAIEDQAAWLSAMLARRGWGSWIERVAGAVMVCVGAFLLWKAR